MNRGKRKQTNQPISTTGFPDLEVDFHGTRPADVSKKLDEILSRHMGRAGWRIQIIHGIGSGILGDTVRRVARSDPRVSDVIPGWLNPGITTLVLSSVKRNVPTRSQFTEESFDSCPIPGIRKRKR